MDIYGKVRKFTGDKTFIPFRYQGQIEDEETDLYYNRFRYYCPEMGTYICQDPIGLDGGPNLYAYVHDVSIWVDPLGLNVSTGAGRTYAKYTGMKGGKPYHGTASAPTSEGLSPQEIIKRRYGGNFDDFDQGQTPILDYTGKDELGKQTARGLEQRDYEKDGGKAGTANKQNPVGPHNKNRDKYLKAADEHQKSKNNPQTCLRGKTNN